MPRVTVAIPVYNREDLVRNSVESALQQELPGLEILIVDNCSTDRTWEVLQSYRDPRIRLVRNDRNLGLFGNFNRCLELASGEYLRFLCSDDRLPAGCLAPELELMDHHREVSLLCARGVRVDSAGAIVGRHADHLRAGVYHGSEATAGILWFMAYYGYNPLNYPSGILLRTRVAQMVGGFDAGLSMCGDVDFFLRVLQEGNLAVIDQVGCLITIHDDQEGAHLAGSTAVMKEGYLLLDRFRGVFPDPAVYRRIRRQLSGVALGLAQKYWRLGDRAAAQAHVELVRAHDTGMVRMCFSLAQLVVLRLLMRATGYRLSPSEPVPTVE